MTRILVMGGGLIGRRHVDRLDAHPVAQCAGLVDPDPAAGEGLGVTQFHSLDEVKGAVDGVIIATPSALHAEHALACAQAGWPVLIEKPVTTRLEDADHLIRTLNTAKALVGHHRRHHARVRALKSLLDAREIGTPLTASLIWAMRKPDDYFAGNWRSAGGSPVMINLVHDLDLLRFWFGEITDLHALAGPATRGTDRMETGSAILRHASDVTASISFSDAAPSPWGFEAGTGENPNIGTTGQDMMWITGTRGGVSFPSLTLWQGEDWSRPAMPQPYASPPETPPLDAQLNHFLDVIAGRSAPLCTLQDGRAALAAALQIETALQASKTPCPSYARA